MEFVATKTGIIYNIEGGPSKDVLMESFKTFKGQDLFNVALRYGTKEHLIPMLVKGIRIARIEHDDGSGKRFNLYGYCQACLTKTESSAFEGDATNHRFTAFYDTERKKGWIRFSE